MARVRECLISRRWVGVFVVVVVVVGEFVVVFVVVVASMLTKR